MGAREECIEIKNRLNNWSFGHHKLYVNVVLWMKTKSNHSKISCKNMFHFHILCYSSRIPNFEVNEYYVKLK